MDGLTLRCGPLEVRVDGKDGSLSFYRQGRRLPWQVEAGEATVNVRDGAGDGPGVAHRVDLGAWPVRRQGAGGAQWIGQIAGAGVALEMRLTEEGLQTAIHPAGGGQAELVSTTWPGRVSFTGEQREVCWTNYNQGALFRADGRPWQAQANGNYQPAGLVALTCGADTLAIICQTHLDWRCDLRDDGRGEMSASPEFLSALGVLGYTRRVLFVPTAEAGHVAAANALRAYEQRAGQWIPWAQRVERNPQVAKLPGAFIGGAGYFHDDGADYVGVMKAMRKMGFERGWFFSPRMRVFDSTWTKETAPPNNLSPAHIAEIQELGYICAPFLQVEEASDSIGKENFAAEANGSPYRRWTIKGRPFYEMAKWRVPGMLPRLDEATDDCLGVHFDTLTAMCLVENYGRLPYDRRGDVRLRLEIARYYREKGKIIGAEGLRDWAVADVDYSTGMTFSPSYPEDPRIWTVPLTTLVWHDSIIRSHWEHHSYDDDRLVRTIWELKFHPFAMELNDLLNAAPPVLFPEGMLYQYQGKKVTRPDGQEELEFFWDEPTLMYHKRFSDPQTQEALPKALRVCRLNQRHGTARMVNHRYLDPASPMVQESEFASGLNVIVNFGDQPYALGDGRTVPARGSIVTE